MFGIPGKAPVTLYTCAYSIKYSNEAPLVDLRAELAALGLARRESVSEPEDHIAALCDVNTQSLDKAAALTGGQPKRFKDYRRLLEDKEIDAVVKATVLTARRDLSMPACRRSRRACCRSPRRWRRS